MVTILPGLLQQIPLGIIKQGQASDAISLFYEIALSNSKNKIATKNNYNETKLKRNQFKLTNADWTAVYNNLNAEIK